MLRVREGTFQNQITQLAELLGWSWAHFRPARTLHGWTTPVSGPMGKGWPDLVMVRRERIVFIELKSEKGKPSPEQWFVHELLRNVGDVYLWRPRDWDEIVKVLT